MVQLHLKNLEYPGNLPPKFNHFLLILSLSSRTGFVLSQWTKICLVHPKLFHMLILCSVQFFHSLWWTNPSLVSQWLSFSQLQGVVNPLSSCVNTIDLLVQVITLYYNYVYSSVFSQINYLFLSSRITFKFIFLFLLSVLNEHSIYDYWIN